jgi:hypothetical protein
MTTASVVVVFDSYQSIGASGYPIEKGNEAYRLKNKLELAPWDG